MAHSAQSAQTLPAGGRMAANDNVVCDELSAGIAGEHLVCADLLLQGYRAFMTDQNCPYDIAVEHEERLIRVQVKSTRLPRAVPQRVNQTFSYMWHVRRAGKGGRRVYGRREFDMLALVALDVRKIAYLPAEQAKQTVHIRTVEDETLRVAGNKVGKFFGDFPFTAALNNSSGGIAA